MKNSVQEEKKIGKDFCKYELTILIHSYLNDEIVQKIVQFLEKKIRG